MSEHQYSVGEEGSSFVYERLDEDSGDAQSLEGQTVTVVFQAPSGALKTKTATVSLVDKLSATYLTQAADFDEEGVWFYEFHETGDDLTTTTRPVAFYVADRLDGA